MINAESVRKYGLPLPTYIHEVCLPELKELVNTYQPACLFADGGEWNSSEEDFHIKEFLSWLYNKAPNREEVVVNDRWCVGMPHKHGDYYSTEYSTDCTALLSHPWEESRGIGSSYGYNRAEGVNDYTTAEDLVQQIVKVVAKGGNFLLNVGPEADGRIPLLQQERLMEIGTWMNVCAESLLDTTPFRPQWLCKIWSLYDEKSANMEPPPDYVCPELGPNGLLTWKDGESCLYLLMLRWPSSTQISIIGIESFGSIELLGSNVVISAEVEVSCLKPCMSFATNMEIESDDEDKILQAATNDCYFPLPNYCASVSNLTITLPTLDNTLLSCPPYVFVFKIRL
eukprot:Platyproteum_vivax@DN6403_c0_g1_i2.p2